MQAPKILVADDEGYVTSLLEHKLRQRGCQVRVAVDGQEALDIARQWHPAVVVADFQMPVLDGLAMALRMSEDPRLRDIPVLMMASRSQGLSPTLLAQTNVRALLPKPFSTRELWARLEEAILERQTEGITMRAPHEELSRGRMAS